VKTETKRCILISVLVAVLLLGCILPLYAITGKAAKADVIAGNLSGNSDYTAIVTTN